VVEASHYEVCVGVCEGVGVDASEELYVYEACVGVCTQRVVEVIKHGGPLTVELYEAEPLKRLLEWC